MDKVFICSPYKGDVERNVALAKKAADFIIFRSGIPIAPHLYFPRFFNDRSQSDRIAGIKMGIELMKDCSEMWVVGTKISAGMEYEIEEARKIGIPVRLYDENLTGIDPDTLLLDDRLDDRYCTVIKGLRFFRSR
ncbi:DUF4406 domain-containing protein [Hornefia porci]|uniref:DUF4406 domain-containing protein n=1 Tax=Hornefia porci TaxID=2652292 RepID=A0A1Q9JFV8_9FIRM|nr:DUF4406 domain-containing protein [Hornefia porci]OLR55073.1 DUF4406 domain-containing protein [Hornefia porci]